MLTFDTFYPSKIHLPDQTLLLNIETTGLSPRNAFVFMIGLGWAEGDSWHFRCLLTEKRSDERQLMENLKHCLHDFKQIFTYGGFSFTYRFLNERWKNYDDTMPFDDSEGHISSLFQNIRQLDIQKEIAPYKHLLSLPDLKKHTVEKWLHYQRPEHLDGKALIKCYTTWELSNEDSLLQQLILHHEADMAGLLALYTLTSYTQCFKESFYIKWHHYTEDSRCHFIIQLKRAVPQPVYLTDDALSITFENDTAHLVIPVFEGELKYFLPGPLKDYYYLPEEDQAVHRSVACYVDKAFRQKATAATCYIRQEGIFLPAGDDVLQPCLKKSYEDKQLYVPYDALRFEAASDEIRHYLSALTKTLL